MDDNSNWEINHPGKINESLKVIEIQRNEISCQVITNQVDSPSILEEIVERHSDWRKIVNIVAWMNRFISNLKDKNYKNKTPFIQKDEFISAENLLLKEAQKISYTRMNMSLLPGNYKNKDTGNCPLCNIEEGSTEHYFKCKKVKEDS